MFGVTRMGKVIELGVKVENMWCDAANAHSECYKMQHCITSKSRFT